MTKIGLKSQKRESNEYLKHYKSRTFFWLLNHRFQNHWNAGLKSIFCYFMAKIPNVSHTINVWINISCYFITLKFEKFNFRGKIKRKWWLPESEEERKEYNDYMTAYLGLW